jgi:hypothetical protein
MRRDGTTKTQSFNTVGARRVFIPARLLAAIACLAALALLPATARAAEEETHVFDATLSLTGSCSESATIDPVPDPGVCPMPPGVPGVDHPEKPFTQHGAVAVDLYGNRFVASAGAKDDGKEGRVDIFSSEGEFITHVDVEVPNESSPAKVSLAVDSDGYLYVAKEAKATGTPGSLIRFKPTEYNAAAGEIEYESPVLIPNPGTTGGHWAPLSLPLAINPLNDHLFVGEENEVLELKSAAEGNTDSETSEVRTILTGQLQGFAKALALDAVRERIYVSDFNQPPTSGGKPVVKVFDLEGHLEPVDPKKPEGPTKVVHDLLFTINGPTPSSGFVSETWALPVAVDETTGHVFIGDMEAPKRQVYEFDADGNPVFGVDSKGDPILTIMPPSGFKSTNTQLPQLAYDDSLTSPTEGYLFVPSHTGPGRSLAFEPKPTTAAPVVESLSVSGVTTGDAILHGKVNPGGLETTYRIEYTTEQAFGEEGFEGASIAGNGTLKPEGEAIAVSAPASGLQPGTAYRFRVVAENEVGEDEADAGFITYATSAVSGDCPNQDLRTGASGSLPDCRAYELVTPADTNGLAPLGGPRHGQSFYSPLASPAGGALSFIAQGGVIPGEEGAGGQTGDPYLATRGDSGWQTEGVGASGAFTTGVLSGTPSPDQLHSLWLANGPGPAQLEGEQTIYLRYPDGHSEPIGKGSLATQPFVDVGMIAENGAHIVFSSNNPILGGDIRQLEPNAPPDGTKAIYDRTPDGTLHVVSLLPGDVTPEAGQHADLKGASPDGEGVAFSIGGTLYLRHDNEVTYPVGTGLTFAGVAKGGTRVFYLQGGDLYRFDAETEAHIPFSESGDATIVNLSADGSAAYFVSPSVLGEGPNPAGESPQSGERNLYLSREGQISFIGTVTQRDVEGVKENTDPVRGLGFWLGAVAPRRGTFAKDPSRTTADGGVLLFESNAPLTEYDPEGHTQVYRYDANEGTLRCLSCNPTGAPPTGDARLQSFGPGYTYLSDYVQIKNLSSGGGRAFFESTEALVVSDTDGLRDVYQWEEEGVGDCETPGGCVRLISSGQSSREDLLYAVSDSGNDVFFRTADLLLAADPDETLSIYDARVGGGFPPPQGPPGECLGGACQPSAPAPNDATPASTTFKGAGNAVSKATKPRCPKGKRAVRRRGKSRCVPRKQNNKRAARANRRAHR